MIAGERRLVSPLLSPPAGGSMAYDRRNEDQEQITDDKVVGRAPDENEELEDVDELDDNDDSEEEVDEDVDEE
jgi:hypothetical protein